jgi:ornithine carbamoyltransferase
MNKVSPKDLFVVLETTEAELTKVIQGMKNKKSAGLDDISPFLLKKMFTLFDKTSIRINQ